MKTDMFDRAKRNAEKKNVEYDTQRKIKLFTSDVQPRRWHNRWTFGAGIIKVDILRTEILTDVGSSKDEFWSFGLDVKSLPISILDRQNRYPVRFRLAYRGAYRSFTRLLDIEVSYLCELSCVKKHSHPMICNLYDTNKHE